LDCLDEPEDSLDSLADDLGQLKVWAENVAAHRRGTMSLDHCLREASTLKGTIKDLLMSIKNVLKDGMYTQPS
jgi:hypothetical protein